MKLDVENVLNTLTDCTVDVLGIDEDMINWGDCFVWADAAHTLFPDSKVVGTYNHCFIQMGDKYYDCHNPLGCFTLYQLGRGSETLREENTNEVLSFWRKEGASHGVEHWKLGAVEKILNETLNVLTYS